MNTAPAPDATPAPRIRRQPLPGLASWVCGGIVAAALAGLSIPAFSDTAKKADRTKSLARVKQVGLALKLFAGDNDGVYPRDGTPDKLKKPATSNAALAVLLPTYTESEMIFGDELSVYQTRKPDNVIDPVYNGKPVKTLEPGENVYGYMMGLTDSSSGSCPLVFDGTDGTGYYTTDPALRGGVNGGVEAIVIRLDNSGVLEPLGGPPNLRFIPMSEKLAERLKVEPGTNLLDAKAYGENAVRLDPAIDPQGKR